MCQCRTSRRGGLPTAWSVVTALLILSPFLSAFCYVLALAQGASGQASAVIGLAGFAMCLGAATFNLLGSLLGGLLMFLLLYFLACWATATDPQILRLLLRAARLHRQYDPAKLTPVSVVRVKSC